MLRTHTWMKMRPEPCIYGRDIRLTLVLLLRAELNSDPFRTNGLVTASMISMAKRGAVSTEPPYSLAVLSETL